MMVPERDDAESGPNRTLSVGSAIVASVFGVGLLYVGRMRLAVLVFVGTWAAIVLMAWARLILLPAGFYVVAAIFVANIAINWFYPPLRAWRSPTQPVLNYNKWWVYVAFAVLSAAVSLTLSLHRADFTGFETFRTPSTSMAPTLEPGDYFVTDSWRYRTTEPNVGDIVVYRLRGEPQVAYVKRVVGGPGDTVSIQGGVLSRNGVQVPERYLHAPDDAKSYGRDLPPTLIPDGRYFVLGDYRDNSADSRSIGPIARDEITGQATLLAFAFADGRIRWDRFGTRLAE